MPSVIRSAVLMTAIACSMSCTAQAPSAGKGEAKDAKAAAGGTALGEKQKNSTMIGMDIAKSLEPFKDEIDVEALTAALRASLAGKPTKLTPAEADQLRQEFGAKMQAKMAKKAAEAGEKNLREGAAFLAANKTKPGVRTTASGLQYMVIRQGTGPMPKPTDRVRVHYVGTLLDGTKFDSSYDRGEPAEFALNQVIPGWSEGVALMPVNSKYKFWIPSNLGYGPNGQPPIGANATLVFEVELLDVK
jgi:FKBP-type peptidyl-prolyl cis-trans isomerase FkpA/FKBP-type peptidyl-prolyl cis-trans isomerase FklB